MSSQLDVLFDNTVIEVLDVRETSILEIVSAGPQGPSGPSGELQQIVQNEVPSGAINSSNMVYTTLASFVKIWVYLNGMRMRPSVDYNVTGINEITFTYAPTTGDTLIVDYIQ